MKWYDERYYKTNSCSPGDWCDKLDTIDSKRWMWEYQKLITTHNRTYSLSLQVQIRVYVLLWVCSLTCTTLQLMLILPKPFCTVGRSTLGTETWEIKWQSSWQIFSPLNITAVPWIILTLPLSSSCSNYGPLHSMYCTQAFSRKGKVHVKTQCGRSRTWCGSTWSHCVSCNWGNHIMVKNYIFNPHTYAWGLLHLVYVCVSRYTRIFLSNHRCCTLQTWRIGKAL